jgi:POT family proton-dependent oligopeptide transporter
VGTLQLQLQLLRPVGLACHLLIDALGFTHDHALVQNGLHTGQVYLTPLFGGARVDRVLGQRRAAVTVISGLVVMLCHFAMACELLVHVVLGLLVAAPATHKPQPMRPTHRASAAA